MIGASVAELFADLLDPAGTPANPANPAKNRAGIDAAADPAPCEGLRKSANPPAELGRSAADSQEFAGLRSLVNRTESKHSCGFSQNSQLSQGSFAERASATAAAEPESRPYRPSKADADAAHAEPWDEAACARFVARVGLLMRRGIDATDADDLAERLHLRDAQADDRVLCLECRHLTGRPGCWRCGNHRAAGVGHELPAVIVTRPARCPGFAELTQ